MDFRSLDWDLALDRLAEQSWIFMDHFLSKEEVQELLQEFQHHRAQEELKKAGIGNSYLFHKNEDIRGDYILWIDPKVSGPHSLALHDRMLELMRRLNYGLRLNMKEIEMHFAIYPPGAFYQRHFDQFKNNGHRILSFACYLNTHWETDHGGEIEIVEAEGPRKVEPLAGRLVVFRSDTVEHAVLETKRDRISITGWMLDRLLDHPLQHWDQFFL